MLFLTKFFHFVAVKNQDILNDASHFNLARSVLKIASFEFANLQNFNSTFMNLKLNCYASFESEMRNSRSRSIHVSDCFVLNKI